MYTGFVGDELLVKDKIITFSEAKNNVMLSLKVFTAMSGTCIAPNYFITKISSPKYQVTHYLQIMAHRRIAMQIKAAGIFQFLMYIEYPMRHYSEIGNHALGNSDTVEVLQETEQIQIEILDFAHLVDIRDIAPGIGEGFFLRLGVGHIYRLEQDIISPLGVKRRVDVDQVDGFILDGVFEDIEAVAVV